MNNKYYDIKTERNVIRILLHKQDICNYAIMYNMIIPEHFIDLFHRDCWNAIRQYYNKHGIVPKKKYFINYLVKSITYSDKFKTKSSQKKLWIKASNKLFIKSENDNIKYFNSDLERLDELRKMRLIQKSVVKIVDNFKIDKIKPIIDTMNHTITECTKVESVITQGNIIDDVDQHKNIDQQMKLGLFKPIPTNFVGVYEKGNNNAIRIIKFDDYIEGGFYDGEFYLIVGETNVGKSFTLMEFAYVASKIEKTNSALYTIEMNKIKEQRRIYSRATGIPYSKFKRGEMTKKDWHKVDEWKEQWVADGNGILEVISFDRGTATTNDIINKHKDIENKYGKPFKIASIDYLNDIKPIGKMYKDDRDWSAIGSVSESLANWSKYHNNHQGLSVVSANQKKTKYYGESKTKLGSGAMSALPEHHATWCVGIGQGEDDQIIGRIRFDLFKNREGEKAISFYMFPKFKTSRINSIKKIKEYYGRMKGADNE